MADEMRESEARGYTEAEWLEIIQHNEDVTRETYREMEQQCK